MPQIARSVTTALLAAVLALAGSAVPALADHDVAPARVSGPDRHATAAGIARLAFDEGATTAFLARGDTFPDALAAAYGAGVVGGPVLLTAREDVPAATMAALDELDVETVVLLGGESAIAESVAERLDDEGYTVERLSGVNRLHTAASVANHYGAEDTVGEVGGDRTAIVAAAHTFADALAAGPLAAGARFPLLLTERERTNAPLNSVLEQLEIDRVLVVGGTAAVSDEVVEQLQAGGYAVERLAGDTRTATAVAIADFAVRRLDWEPDVVHLVRGDDFPDALAAGPLAGLLQSPIVLAADPHTLGSPSASWLAGMCPAVAAVRALGGEGAVSTGTLQEAESAAQSCHPGSGDRGPTYIVAPQEAQVAEAPHTYELAVAGRYDEGDFTGPVDLALFPCANVTATESPVRFADDDGDGRADGIGTTDTDTALITSVHGVALESRWVTGAEPGERGVIEFEVGADRADCAVPAVFADADGDGQLDVDADGHPIEPFGVAQVAWTA